MPEQTSISGWTVQTLHDHIKSMMDERDKRYEQLAGARSEAMIAALESSQRAVDKAEGIAEKWREHSNEWRATMSDKDKNYLTKDAARGYFIAGLMAAGAMIGVAELFARLLFK